jgi:hypothetical protein
MSVYMNGDVHISGKSPERRTGLCLENTEEEGEEEEEEEKA